MISVNQVSSIPETNGMLLIIYNFFTCLGLKKKIQKSRQKKKFKMSMMTFYFGMRCDMRHSVWPVPSVIIFFFVPTAKSQQTF
jgi:hypothetical protein